ncbi:MAG: rhodanese-like domain-containing protein [Syntrophothermus sp.]
MPRRFRERRYRRNRRDNYNRPGSRLTSAFRTPKSQLMVLAVVALIILLLALWGNNRAGTTSSASLPPEISVSEAYTKYQNGAFVLDVRTPEEWNEFHAPNSTLIPLDQLASRLNELPRDREIVVVCRSGNRSQQGRDILLNAGFQNVTSMKGGLTEWRASGYPVQP